ncbi:hypothetical protein [Clostridium magnum]|uniref:Uncharacterized protein n=1 Tax=Clostridium magnum DSM 2767 TaxID=1121326 RepID=A0A162UXM3_9CLOT|nr:hypothetical protein [Clostridium magnum]KZL94391.1 hypothetical protein CLMAG_14440 [Clostridium magnum DSM 2767]SHJ59201.1 hypothetical protein SAMN02745944_06199 [Clostridium magnum DSM 2767]
MFIMTLAQFLAEATPQEEPEFKFMFDLDSLRIVEGTKDLIQRVDTLNDNIKHFFEVTGKLYYYLTNPKVLVWWLWGGVVKHSFWICLFICLFSTIAFIIGWKKGKKVAASSIFIYLVIQMFSTALK